MKRCLPYAASAAVLISSTLFSVSIWATTESATSLTYVDPKGDDNGSGKATYPTSKEYTPGAFDLVKLDIRTDGEETVFEVEVADSISDPWNSKDWGGNGFSLQFVQIYLDTDGK